MHDGLLSSPADILHPQAVFPSEVQIGSNHRQQEFKVGHKKAVTEL